MKQQPQKKRYHRRNNYKRRSDAELKHSHAANANHKEHNHKEHNAELKHSHRVSAPIDNKNNLDDAFPSATLLQEYEYATEGAANRLLDLAVKEQQHRFAMQESYERFNKKTIRIAQLFGFIAFMTVLIESYLLIIDGKEDLGLEILFGTMLMAFAASILFAVINRGGKRYVGN